jgi:hypothetical protein
MIENTLLVYYHSMQQSREIEIKALKYITANAKHFIDMCQSMNITFNEPLDRPCIFLCFLDTLLHKSSAAHIV